MNLEDRFLNQTWDYGAIYSLPWQAGITGIAYNPELTGRELRSINDLFDPEFNGPGRDAHRDARLGRARDARPRPRPAGRSTRTARSRRST